MKKLNIQSINNVTRDYNLIANIIHDGTADKGSYRVQVKKHSSREDWVDIQDLYVANILPQDVVVSQSYIHFYESS
jgi:U4/U6.U5 tri-snRNP-associated protein 2